MIAHIFLCIRKQFFTIQIVYLFLIVRSVNVPAKRELFWRLYNEYDDFERDKNGNSFAGKTYMDYFSEKKYEYFDVPKLAAYYIYLMRFAAVDQSVKNSMLTT